jgi:hypothetical protein
MDTSVGVVLLTGNGRQRTANMPSVRAVTSAFVGMKATKVSTAAWIA